MRLFRLKMTSTKTRLQLRATVDHAGLVRSKRGFGVRVGAAQYGLIRQKLLPGAPESSGSDEGGDKKFRLLGVPKALDRSGLKKVLQELGWTAKALRSQAFQCWVVASANNPPNRFLQGTQNQSRRPTCRRLSTKRPR